ncbi:MAG TPA: 4'-phosphopantetheinyl transferase superfamily protein [Xanthobacteraceae bacterium]|nr:4'-phosphopantetheinyl transferase superfamily protein [Xanthobacteraceae bacterium]
MTPLGAAAADEAVDPALARALLGFAPPGVLVAHRLILCGDDDTLLPEEAATMTVAQPARRRASGAARLIARELLSRLGCAPGPLPKTAAGAPLWPRGVVGSLAHDDRVALAAVARQRDVSGLGIDVEPATALPAELLDLVATPREQRRLGGDLRQARLLFAAKEAVYKALHPRDGVFLEFHEIEVDLAAAEATVRSGSTCRLRFCRAAHFVALALVVP